MASPPDRHPAEFAKGVFALIERACIEPELLRQLKTDPVGTALSVGVQPNAEDLKCLLGIRGATDDELLQVLMARMLPRLQGR